MSEHENIKDKTQNKKFVNNISQLQTNENLNNKDNEILVPLCESPTNLQTSPKSSLRENARSLPSLQDADKFHKHHRQPNVRSQAHRHSVFGPPAHKHDWQRSAEDKFEPPSVISDKSVDTDNLSSNSLWGLQNHPHGHRNNKTLKSSGFSNFPTHELFQRKIQQRQFYVNRVFGGFSTKGSVDQSIGGQYSPDAENTRNQLQECENSIKKYSGHHAEEFGGRYSVDPKLEVNENVRKYSVDHTPDGEDAREIFHGAQTPEVKDTIKTFSVLKQDEGDSGVGRTDCQSRKVEEIRGEISAKITHPHAEDTQHENHSAADTGNWCFKTPPNKTGNRERTNSESQQVETPGTRQMRFEALSVDTGERYRRSQSHSLTELDYGETKCQPLLREEKSNMSSKPQSFTQGTAVKSKDFTQSANRYSLNALHSNQYLNSDHQNNRTNLQRDKELVPFSNMNCPKATVAEHGADPELGNKEEELNIQNEQVPQSTEADVYLRLHEEGHFIEEAEGAVGGFQNDDPPFQSVVNKVALVLPPPASRPVSEETKSCIDRLLPVQESQFPDADTGFSSANRSPFSTELHLPFREDGGQRLAPGSMVHTGHRHNCGMAELSPSYRSPDERCVVRGVESFAPVPAGYSPPGMTTTRRRGRVRSRDSSTRILTGILRRYYNEPERLQLLRGAQRPAALHHEQRRPTSDPALGVHCRVAVGVTVTPDEQDFQFPGVVDLMSSAARASRVPEIRDNLELFSFIHLRPGVSVQREQRGEDNLIPVQVAELAHRAPPDVAIYHQDRHDIDLQLRRLLGPHLHLRPGSTIQLESVTEVVFTGLDVSLSSALRRHLAYRMFAGLDPHTVYEAEEDENGDTNASDIEDDEGAT